MKRTLETEPLTFFRGRVGLYALLKALGIGPGDDVAIQAFTCVAVPEGVMASGARPIYVDIERTGFNMDAGDLRVKATPRTRAVVVQHTYGIPSDMRRIPEVAARLGIPIVEDCCHTLLSKYRGKTLGSFGVGSFYSFEWGKPVVAGVGGRLRINDPFLEGKVRKRYDEFSVPGLFSRIRIELQYRAFSVLYRPALFWPVRSLFHLFGSLGMAERNYNPVGTGQVANDFKLRMAPGVKRRMLEKLKEVESHARHSAWVTDQYRERIKSQAVSHPKIAEGCDAVFARYPLLAKKKPTLLLQACRKNVELAEWYATPLHPLKGRDLGLVHYESGSCPNAEARCKEVVTLPVHGAVRQSDIDRTVAFFNQVGG